MIEGVEVVNSGNGGGGACHNGKPHRRNDKVLNGRGARRVRRGTRRTCHNDKPGQMMGMIMEVEERSR